jgi:hypothetical protein
MSGPVFQARSEAAAAASARSASARATTIRADPPESATGLDELHAALNDTSRVRQTRQLRSSLSESPRVAQLARVARLAQRVPAAGQVVQRLELTDKMWTHIAKGELREGNKKLVGYHWTGDGAAIAMKNGEDKKGPNDLGIYVEGVRSVQTFGQGKKAAPVTKGTPSTFWPDAWSEAEIKDAIANGGKAGNNISTVNNKATKTEARGMRLFVNPESVFPVYEPSEEKEESGGRKRGKKK